MGMESVLLYDIALSNLTSDGARRKKGPSTLPTLPVPHQKPSSGWKKTHVTPR
jgi:hypothetical protein